MKQTLRDIKVEYDPPISIICDNTSAINISKYHVVHLKTKHIPIKYHFLREQVAKKKCQDGIYYHQRIDCEYFHKTPSQRDI
jgi:hypothetical protein